MSETTGIVRLYSAGGGGINLGSHWAGNIASEPGVAEVQPVFIDTSRTNVRDGIDESNSYILPDLDGSGKVRRENHEVLAREIPRILLEHPPRDFNVVVFTGSGGTGSVLGPLIIAQLLERDCNVVAVVIGSEESAITALNSFNTLKSLDHIARSKGKPVAMFYSRNTRELKRSEIDRAAKHVLVSLTYLASRQNKELDTKDIHHWINFNKSTQVPAQLCLLNAYTSLEDVEQHAPETFSLISLLKDEDEAQPNITPAYSGAGYYREGVKNPCNLFFTLDTKGLNGILNHLQKLSKSFEEQKGARQEGPAFVSDKDQVSDTGLIL